MKQKPSIKFRVLEFIRKNNLVSPGGVLPVAVSGGPDSVCLLHVLNTIKKDLGIELLVLHLDHMIRGEESARDASYVAGLAAEFHLPATIKSCDVAAYRTENRRTLEEAAREVRYSFFADAANQAGADRIAVGHTRNDNIETILMHLVRGTGTRGMRGLQPESVWRLGGKQITVVRPLLEITREETERYCRHYSLQPRIDSSNLSLSPLRNRIRLQLIPALESYNKGFGDALLRTAATADCELRLLDEQTITAWKKTVKIQKETAVIDKKEFKNLHPALQRNLLRMAFERTAGDLKDIESRHIEEIMAALNKPAGKLLHLPYQLIFAIEYDKYLLGKDPAALSPYPPFEKEIDFVVPGRTEAGPWLITTSLITPEKIKRANRLTAWLDYGKTGNKLTVRTVLPGDRFQPRGLEAEKKLGEFMIDARIPHAWRSRIPVICSPEQILWLVGQRIDDRVKVSDDSRQVLKIAFRLNARPRRLVSSSDDF
jgi:tRNA(Ile)-lysidine synthase